MATDADYVATADVERVGEHGATVSDASADRAWGERLASIFDPDGNLLHIGSGN